MASGAQQLKQDHEQISALLEKYPSIKLLKTEGNPPEQYDLEYNIKGYKANPDGTASPDSVHQVRINLPFGYPHFPPTAKPLTPIFHPDIDPDAIRIADFWEKSKSLADLIIHIGNMICGATYSSEEPFNQRAFDWYEERKSWMPFDILEPGDSVEEEAEEADLGNDTGDDQVPGMTPEKDAGTDDGLDKIAPALEDFEGGEDYDEIDRVLDGLDGDEEPDEFDLGLDSLEEDTGDSTDDFSLDSLIADTDELENDLTFAIEDDFDQPDSQEETVEVDFELEAELPETQEATEGFHFEIEADLSEEQSADAEGPVDLADLPADEPAFVDELGDGQDDQFEAIELGDLESIDEGTPDDTFELAAEHEGDGSDSIELGDLDGLDEGGGLDSFSLDEDDLAGLEALADEPGEADDGATAETAPAGETQEDSFEEGGLQLDDSSSDGYPGGAKSIRPLIEGKKIFAAQKILKEIEDPAAVPDFKELQLTISAAISEAEELYKKADKLEHKGELEKAGLVLDLVANIATDYPGLEQARNRIRETKVTGDEEKAEAEREEREKARQERQPRFKIPYKAIAVVLVLAALGGGGTFIYLRDSQTIATAQASYSEAERLLKNKDFKQAQAAFTDARAALEAIVFLKKEWKSSTLAQIDSTVNSQAFKEGLQGKVLHEGQYVTVEMAKALDQFQKKFDLAEQTLAAGNIEQAIVGYQESAELAEKAGFEEQAHNIRQTIVNLNLQQTLALARKAEEEKEWKQAADTYRKALELSSNLAQPDEQADISQRLAAAAFRHELDESKRAFTSSEWQKTIEMLQRAQKILDENPNIASKTEQEELSKLLVNSRLYQILAAAKKAFEQKVWDLAIHNYRGAIDLLDKNAHLLGKDEVAENTRAIEKTILMTHVAREQHLISIAVTAKDLEAVLKHYQAVVALIEKSSFKDDQALLEIMENARTQEKSVKKELLVNRRIDWLLENYERIFREHYPSASSSELLNPKVTFAKREGDIMVFAMSCVENNQGRKFRLELNYQYDLKRDTWKLYSGDL